MLATESLTGVFAFPTRVMFGPGMRHVAPRELATWGKRTLVVTDKGIRAMGILDEVLATLRTVGIECEVYDGVHPNPIASDVENGLAVYRAARAEFIVALGGGSALDTAKAIRLCVNHPLPLDQYDDRVDGSRLVTEPMPALAAYPTTAGTGSEVSRSAVIGLGDAARKTVLFAPPLIPTLAVCDPELTLDLPPGLTAASGADALSHGVEAYLARGFHPIADVLALQAVRYVFRYLRRAVLDGRDLEARAHMMLASIVGAMAFQKGLGACHSMAHPLSSRYGLHHGLANALCLPAVVRFNAQAVPDRMRELLRAVGFTVDTISSVDAAALFVRELRALFSDVGLPQNLLAAGVEKPDWEALTFEALADGCHSGNPRPVRAEDFRVLYQSLTIG